MTQRTRRVQAEDYLHWLTAQLRDEHGNPSKTYDDLARLMFEKEFRYVLPMDDNRMVDGMDLRVEFARVEHIPPTRMPQNLGPCKFLEVLIGLSRRMEFTGGGNAAGWAWQLLCNLELDRMSDPLSKGHIRWIDQVMETVIRRTYSPDGTGGFFPLNSDDDDQTRIELWYQMNAYIIELHQSGR